MTEDTELQAMGHFCDLAKEEESSLLSDEEAFLASLMNKSSSR